MQVHFKETPTCLTERINVWLWLFKTKKKIKKTTKTRETSYIIVEDSFCILQQQPQIVGMTTISKGKQEELGKHVIIEENMLGVLNFSQPETMTKQGNYENDVEIIFEDYLCKLQQQPELTPKIIEIRTLVLNEKQVQHSNEVVEEEIQLNIYIIYESNGKSRHPEKRLRSNISRPAPITINTGTCSGHGHPRSK